MLIANTGQSLVIMNLRTGEQVQLPPGQMTPVLDSKIPFIDDSFVLISLFNTGVLVAYTDAGAAYPGFPTTANPADSKRIPPVDPDYAAAVVVGGAVSRIAVGVLGQSNERGQVDPTESIGGIVSRTAYPQAFGSLRNPSLRYPISPALSKLGGPLFAMYDALYDHGYDAQIINYGIGSLSMIRDAIGQVQTRANNTQYRARRAPVGLGDNGYAGDYMVVQGRVFLCTTGVQVWAQNANSSGALAGAIGVDYIRTVGTNATAASEPAGLATAAVGDVVTDGTVQWTCLSTSTTYNGYSYGAGNVLTESRAGFDPFGLLHGLLRDLWAVRDARARYVMLQNGQSDTGSLTYQQALEGIAGFFLQRGVKVLIGLTCYAPSIGTSAYDALTTRVNNALASARAGAGTYYAADDVITGANLYSLMGSAGPMASGGAYFAKDSGQDNIHLNAPGAIVAGNYMAQPIKALLP